MNHSESTFSLIFLFLVELSRVIDKVFDGPESSLRRCNHLYELIWALAKAGVRNYGDDGPGNNGSEGCQLPHYQRQYKQY